MITQHDISEPHQIPIIALLTDFGADSYVGVMKGVILSICPHAQLIDLTHAIQPQNVPQAAHTLLNAVPYMPPHTIYDVVVDPGVGSARKPIAVKTNRGIFVGPDNGVFSYVLKHLEIETIVALQNPEYRLSAISATFHGARYF